MQKFQVILTNEAQFELDGFDGPIRRQILYKIRYFAAMENPFASAKRLTGSENRFRWRSGNYRIIFTVKALGDEKILLILHIGNRRNIYSHY